MAEYSTIVKLARQGDPRAIAYLITRTLQKYGITARAHLKGHCLKLLLEAEQVPHQGTMVKLVAQGMKKLNANAIQTIKLYGRKLDQATPAWRHVIELSPKETIASTPSMELTTELDSSEVPIFQLEDLAPDTMILLPVEPKVQLEDLDPDALILFPVQPAAAPSIELAESTEQTLASVSTVSTHIQPASDLTSEPDFSTPALLTKLPKQLTRVLLGLLWLRFGIDSLILIHSLLSAGSFSLYAGLDLANVNQPFAGLLAVVVNIADFLFTPLGPWSLWITLITTLLFLLWIYRLHHNLRELFHPYPISPGGAVLRFVLPLYNLWGIGNTFFTLARHLKTRSHQITSSRTIRRLTLWLYGLLLLTAGSQGLYLWLLIQGTSAIASLWFYVVRDAVIWLLSLTWLQLVGVIWRAVRRVYQEAMPVIQRSSKSRAKSSRISIRAILLGGGACLLSLIVFNCLLGFLAALVFVSNGLQPASILPTFYDSESLLILVLLGSFLCIGLGGFLTAQLAIKAGLAHALGLGILLTLVGIGLQQSTLLPAITKLPFWFQTVSAVLIIPATLLGGGLRQWLRSL